MFKARLLVMALPLFLMVSCASPIATPVPTSPTLPSKVTTSTPTPPPTTMLTPTPTPEQQSQVLQTPTRFVLSDLTITPTAVKIGEDVTISIQVSNIGGTDGSYTVVFKYKNIGGSIGSENVEVTLKPGQTKTATLTMTNNESGTYVVNVNDKVGQYTVTTPMATEHFARQTALEIVTNNAAIGNGGNNWGGHQTRIVHTQQGIFTAYTVEGSGEFSRVWQLAQRQSDGTWAIIAQGDAGMNPVNLLASPDGTLHIIGWPNGFGTMYSGKPQNGKIAITSERIPNKYQGNFPYSSAGIDASGNLCILSSDGGQTPGGTFSWACYLPSKSQWVPQNSQLDFKYCYTYVFTGPNGQLSLVATRDVRWSALGYSQPPGSFDYVFNAFRYWRTNDINSDPIKVLTFAEEVPTEQYPEPFLNAQTDAYLDTKDRMHILYTRRGATTGGKDQYRHRIVSASGTVLFDEEIPKEAGSLCRIFQDNSERFYLLGQSGLLYLMDQEGQKLGTPIKLDLGGHKVEYSGYYLSVPRTGTSLSDVMDIVFPSDNGRSWLYFQLDFGKR